MKIRILMKFAHRFLTKDLTEVEESDKITFGNRYQYNVTSALTYNKDKAKRTNSGLAFLSKAVEGSEKDFNEVIKARRSHIESISVARPQTQIPETARPSIVPSLNKPFHRTVNSVDIQSASEVKSKQILFYSDLVN